MGRQLPNWLEAFMYYTENSEPPDLYRTWVAVSVVAAVLRRKCHLKWGYDTLYPNFYIVLVGPPGKCRKGTAMAPGFDLLRDLGIKMAAESITREALIRELKNAGDTLTDPINGKIYFHSSLTIFSPELTVFLGYNNHQLMSDLTDWFDCRERWTYRTKNMGTDDITGVWVNLIGATTPDLIQSTLPMDAIGGGLTSRMIFVYADKKGKLVPAPFLSPKIMALREPLIQDLEQISMISGEFRVTQGFLDTYTDWYIEQEKHPPFKDNRLAAYSERRSTHVRKLSMIFNVMRDNGEMKINKDDFLNALNLLETTEVKMLETFGGVGKSKSVDITNKIFHLIGEVGEISRADLLRQVYHDVDVAALDAVLATIEAMDGITKVYNGSDVIIKLKYKAGMNDPLRSLNELSGEGSD